MEECLPCVGCGEDTYGWDVMKCGNCRGIIPICGPCYWDPQNGCDHRCNKYNCHVCGICWCGRRKTALAFAALRSAEAARNAWADMIEWVIARMN
jgi:hypothetical protein